MSYCREEGKDRIIFVTKEDHEKPSTALITTKDDDEEEEPGLILKDGTINWNCPCLGGMASGPCGIQFREAFSCFHYSDAQPKGSNCFEPFKTMQDCMSQYPDLYPKDEEESKDPLANAPDKLEENVTQETNNSEPVKEPEETSSKAIAPDALPTEKVPVKATS